MKILIKIQKNDYFLILIMHQNEFKIPRREVKIFINLLGMLHFLLEEYFFDGKPLKVHGI
ncbi:TPA: hypothetical protein DIC40_08410 [Patescibacteria group bacterium]|nr:hypothetical protein [Candidatus Gracilibacteria bacterium]